MWPVKIMQWIVIRCLTIVSKSRMQQKCVKDVPKHADSVPPVSFCWIIMITSYFILVEGWSLHFNNDCNIITEMFRFPVYWIKFCSNVMITVCMAESFLPHLLFTSNLDFSKLLHEEKLVLLKFSSWSPLWRLCNELWTKVRPVLPNGTCKGNAPLLCQNVWILQTE